MDRQAVKDGVKAQLPRQIIIIAEGANRCLQVCDLSEGEEATESRTEDAGYAKQFLARKRKQPLAIRMMSTLRRAVVPGTSLDGLEV